MTLRETLDALCARAHARAVSSGAPVVACYVGAANGGEPLAALEAREPGPAAFRFVWERPKDGMALAARGAALRFRSEGPRRFQDMSELVETALRSAVCAGEAARPLGLPYALGGFAFFDEVNEEQWPGFGTGQMVIPAWMTLRLEGRTHTVVSGAVHREDDPAAVAARMAAGLDFPHPLPAAEIGAPGAGAGFQEPPPAPSGAGGRGFRRADDVEGHRHWLAMVRTALAGIEGGRISKVVLARSVDLVRKALPFPYPVLRALRAAYPGCFAFLVDPGAGQHFLGATPERLARLSGEELRLGAMAGSAPRGDRPDADEALGRRLLEDPKERWEHAIVVDSILEAVRPFGGELEAPEAPRLVKLTNVQHLYTPITLRLKEPVSLLALLARLHPTPAVGGFPREEALRLIRDEERFDRGWYAGPVGWINARGDGEFAVALRSGVFRNGHVRLFTGAGIVADSDPETEYFETQLKLQPMLGALSHE